VRPYAETAAAAAPAIGHLAGARIFAPANPVPGSFSPMLICLSSLDYYVYRR